MGFWVVPFQHGPKLMGIMAKPKRVHSCVTIETSVACRGWMVAPTPPAGPHLECPILSWVTDLPDSGGSETNFEFDFDKNLVTDAAKR